MSVREAFVSGRDMRRARTKARPFVKASVVKGDQVRIDSLGDVSKRLAIAISRVIQTFDCESSPRYLRSIVTMLESLPLSTSEFDLAQSRIKNAKRYAEVNEPGAAIYELRLLLRWLRNWD